MQRNQSVLSQLLLFSRIYGFSFVCFTDGQICWVVRGAHLEVINVSTRNRVAAWRFGKVLKDEHTSITCVKEFEHGKKCKLLVGVCNASSSGLLCLFDVAASKVVKAVEIPQQVHIITITCPCNIQRFFFSCNLKISIEKKSHNRYT